MKAKEFIPPSKPRNFVAKNQKTAGAGAHKDKKKAEKQGDVKHKNKFNYRQDDWSQDFERRMKEGVAEGDSPGMKDGRPYSDPLRRHPGNDSYMTPDYLIQKYQDELKKIAAGPYKRPKDVAMYQARIAKLQRQQGVAEATPETTVSALRGYKTWQVWIKNNYYNGKYPDYSARPYRVIAGSADEARHVVLDNADRVLKDLLSKKFPSGKRVLPPKSALPIEAKHIGAVDDGTEKGQITTSKPITMLSPQGPMTVMLDAGNIVDVVQSVAEGSFGSGYGSVFTLYVNSGEKPTTKTKTKKFKREDDAVLWAEDYADQHDMFPNLKMEIQDENGNVVWELEESQGVAEGWGQREFEVNGYTYITDIDEEEDNRKIFHMLKTPEGKTIDIDFTPYAYMSKDDVELYIKLGMPKRQGIGPLDSEKLQKMAQIKGVAMLDPKMARAGMK
jgi:hypothetical protein